MNETRTDPILDLLATVGTSVVRDRFREQPLRFGRITLVVDKLRVRRDNVVVQCRAQGPLGITARAEAVITVESVSDERSVLQLSLASRHRVVEQLLGALLPTTMPRLDALLRARGIAGVNVHGSQITIEHDALARSLVANPR